MLTWRCNQKKRKKLIPGGKSCPSPAISFIWKRMTMVAASYQGKRKTPCERTIRQIKLHQSHQITLLLEPNRSLNYPPASYFGTTKSNKSDLTKINNKNEQWKIRIQSRLQRRRKNEKIVYFWGNHSSKMSDSITKPYMWIQRKKTNTWILLFFYHWWIGGLH